jgi:hypothetical protein
MLVLPEKARAYLDGLEAERLAALALSQQKAEEAKLIKARQEGFQAALDMLRGELPVERAEANTQAPGRRRGRRPIRQIILRELSFSGQSMTTAQIARAIEYNRERTETALKRMEKNGHVLRAEGERWEIGARELDETNRHAFGAGNGKFPEAPDAE